MNLDIGKHLQAMHPSEIHLQLRFESSLKRGDWVRAYWVDEGEPYAQLVEVVAVEAAGFWLATQGAAERELFLPRFSEASWSPLNRVAVLEPEDRAEVRDYLKRMLGAGAPLGLN